MTKLLRSSTLAFAAGALLSIGGVGRAEEPAETGPERGIDHAVPAVYQALEIGIGGGYSQGIGDIAKNMNTVQDVSGPGGGVELQLGYRIIPELAIGAYGTYSQQAKGDAMDDGHAHGATAGVFANWHFRPARSIDPWIGVATGWRALWTVPAEGENTTFHGLEIARLQVGLDYRITPEVAIAPVIGAGMSVFLTRNGPGTDGFDDVKGSHPSFFFFGGLLGRFDLFGRTDAPKGVLVTAPH